MMYKYSDYMSDLFINNVLNPYLSKQRNQRTAVEYAGYIRILCNKVRKDFLEITAEEALHVFDSWKSLIPKGELTRKTVCVRLSCYNSISRYIKENLADEFPDYTDPFINIQRPDVIDQVSPNNIPSTSDIDKIITLTADNPMHYLILALITRACISTSKVTQITTNMIIREGEKRAILFKNNKNPDKFDIVTLPKDVGKLLDNYIATLTHFDSENHIFYNEWGNALSIKNLDTIISKYVKRAGLSKDYTAKDFRARGILELVRVGANEASVMQYTGLGAMRIQQFYNVKSLLYECPADLVNYELKTL